MQRALILVLSLFATVTIGINDDFAERLSQTLSLTKTDVQICMNKTNVQLEDIEKLDEMIITDIHTPEIEDSVVRVGCLFACISQKKGFMSGARFNMNKIKELLDTKLEHSLTPEKLAERNRILETCDERVKSKTNECEVAIQFFLCVAEYAL